MPKIMCQNSCKLKELRDIHNIYEYENSTTISFFIILQLDILINICDTFIYFLQLNDFQPNRQPQYPITTKINNPPTYYIIWKTPSPTKFFIIFASWIYIILITSQLILLSICSFVYKWFPCLILFIFFHT
jgi:hypothetical protein